MIPENFGEVNGTPISNKDTILGEVNIALGEKKNPSVEYLLSRPFSFFPLPFGYGFNYNSYGHSAVRYQLNGEDIVMNIEGKRDGIVMIVFYKASEYLYGTNEKENGSQRGVYNRNIAGIRIENVNQEDIQKMHDYFVQVQKYDRMGLKKFNIIAGPVINFCIRALIKWAISYDKKYELISDIDYDLIRELEYGNCSKWVSEGLKRAGIIKSTKVWPKSVLVDIFENYTKSKVNIVCYQQPETSKLAYGYKKITLFESVAPFQPLRDFVYSNMLSYANCIVTIPNKDIRATVLVNSDPIKPNQFRNLVNNNGVAIVSSLIFGTAYFLLLKRSVRFASYYLRLKTYSKTKFEKVKENLKVKINKK